VLLSLPTPYIVGMLFWLLFSAVMLRVLLRMRRQRQGRTGRLGCVNAGLSVWLLLALLTGCELYFALCVDQSDSFNMTNVSKRWFDRHIERQRNAFGSRDIAQFPRQIPPNTRRICFIGDSFTVGHGIPNMADRFSDRISADLEKVRPGKFLVANLGASGWEISRIEAFVHGLLKAGYETEMLIYVLCLNDIEGYDPRTSAAIQELQQAEPKFFLLTDTYFLNWLYFRLMQINRPGARDYFPHLVDSYELNAWDGFSRKLDQLHRRCQEHDVELRLVIFPFLNQLGPDYPFLDAHGKLVEHCNRSAIPVLDLEPVFRGHAGEDLTVNRFDSHPNERAHGIAAQAIREHLLNDLFYDNR
jgi:hypothetical protein